MSFAVSGDVEELDVTQKNTLKIFKNITLVHEAGMVMLEVNNKHQMKDIQVPFIFLTSCVSVFLCSG